MARKNDPPITKLDLYWQSHRNADFAARRPAPATAIQDAPTRCLVINAEWMSLLAGQVERLAFHEVWEGDTDTRENAIENIVQILSMMGDCGLITDIRQKPDDNCILQYSQDGGLTWVDGFDFSLCLKSEIQPMFDALASGILQDLLDKYDGTANSISEDLVYDGGPDDAFRDIALCNALQIFVDAMCDVEINRRAQAEQFWEDVPEVLESVAIILLAVPIPGARFLAFAAAAVGVFIEIAGPIWNLATLTALQDENAREQVACSMYEELSGATPTFSAFQTSLDNPQYSPISNAAFIGNAIKAMIQELEIYIAFLQMWADVYPYAKGGFLDICDCPDLGWTAKFLNGVGRPPNWAIVSNPPYNDASYNSPGDYWFSTDTPSEPVSSVFCNIEFEVAGTFTVEWITMDIDLQTTSGNSFSTGQQFDVYDDLGVLIESHNEPGYNQNNTPATITWEKQNTGVQKIRLHAKLFEPDNGETTRAEIREIRVHGTGTIPPEWAAYEV